MTNLTVPLLLQSWLPQTFPLVSGFIPAEWIPCMCHYCYSRGSHRHSLRSVALSRLSGFPVCAITGTVVAPTDIPSGQWLYPGWVDSLYVPLLVQSWLPQTFPPVGGFIPAEWIPCMCHYWYSRGYHRHSLLSVASSRLSGFPVCAITATVMAPTDIPSCRWLHPGWVDSLYVPLLVQSWLPQTFPPVSGFPALVVITFPHDISNKDSRALVTRWRINSKQSDNLVLENRNSNNKVTYKWTLLYLVISKHTKVVY